jgi:hypothetical protein
MRFRSSYAQAFTLLELLVYCSLWTVLALTTMRVIGEARVVRANARDRSILTLIAQDELERLRSIPTSQLSEGVTTRSLSTWPRGTEARIEIHGGPQQTLELDVQVSRVSIEGKPSVQLTTLRPSEVPR